MFLLLLQMLGNPMANPSVCNIVSETYNNNWKSKSNLYYYRRSICQSVLVSGTHVGPVTNFSPSLFNHFYTVTGFLMWGAFSDEKSVWIFQFLLGIASAAFLGSDSYGTHEHILLPLFFRLPKTGGPGFCIYFPQEQGSPVMPPKQ
jgi:hypothetical protein